MVAGGLAFTIPGAGCWAMPTRSAGLTCLSWRSPAPSWACWPPRSSTVTLSWMPRLSSPPATPQLRPCARPRLAANRQTALGPWPSRHLQRAARRPGCGAQHAMHAQHPRRDLWHLQLAHAALRRLPRGFARSPSGLSAPCWATLASSWAAPLSGLFDVVTAQGIVKSLGMGLMMGFGVAVVLKDILPQVAGTSAVLPPTAPPTPTSNRSSRAPLSSTPASSAWALPPSP